MLVLGVVACSITALQIAGNRAAPIATPTRTLRPTWTPFGQGLAVATPTLDATRYPGQAVPTTQPPTPQVLVPGSAQGLVVPGSGNQAVQTVVVILITATPAPTTTPRPAGPTFTPSATFTPGPPTATPTVTGTPLPPVVVHTKVDQANVRQGPGELYPLITVLDKDTAVTVVGRNRAGNWWKICCVNGSDVWIADAVVTVDGPLWAVAEITDVPPPPPVPPTPTQTLTPSPTPTYAWTFRLESSRQYVLGQNYFRVVGALYNGATPLWGYRLRIRKLSTGQEWMSDPTEAYWKGETVEWFPEPTPNLEVKRNVKWDSNAVGVAMGDDTWEVTATDGAGVPLSAPVRFNTSTTKLMWYYVVFTTAR